MKKGRITIGHVKIEVDKKERTYSVKYALDSAAGVKSLLRDRHRISSARFRGDRAASDILLDLNSAIYNAGLTERQTEAVALISGFDLTQAEAARVMGIARQVVARMYAEAAEKLAAVYRRWEYGEVTVEYTGAGDNEREAA
ncbi:uncharacterized protein DUF134 [Fontibacillus phaseoli]|uniref:Uncharacterized protein DUF134 n=1 Tax=Fontibacillus phaseoli TaxID=1416533 RepID=A0A369BN08_9BACL|nr:DUF134 domain-containing protein [Fontibacillus phaseoli]RCX22933.1 uncharacterized protein DUF134 [Fontibacillus phaseoli]